MSKSRGKGKSNETKSNPKWWDELLIKTKIARSFILH